MTYEITPDRVPALGDIRKAGAGDWIYVSRLAPSHADWPRIWDALGVAFARGARIIQLWEG